MEDEKLSGVEGLQVIQSMINKAKNQFTESGHLYLLWGWLILVCSIIEFILMKVVQYKYHYMIWMVTWIAVIYQIFYIYKREKKRRVRTYTDDILAFVWIVFVIMMVLVMILSGRMLGNESFKIINPVFLALYGMPTFLSGVILRFKPLRIGGICCWILSILSTYVDPDYRILFVALAVTIAWIIPGYSLRARHKKLMA